ncbi:MAG: hypothetical protein LRS48_00145, partial [Desulfurococcales archaeon]|nr:hypothetical protein [Desulfurococcales archaeon]
VENNLRALAEASFSRLALGELERLGYKVLDYKRNVMIGERKIGLTAYTVRGNEEYTIVLEVKSKPDHADAAKLVGVADMVAGSGLARGRIVPALAGVLVGSDVEAYARKLGVLVLKL